MRREFPPELADEILRWTVMVSEVPGGESGIVISEHFGNCARRLDAAVRAGDLPHAVSTRQMLRSEVN